MPRSSDNDSESSLPTKTLPSIPSSPPLLTRDFESPDMNNGPALNPEPPATKEVGVSQGPPGRVRPDETERPHSAQQLHDDEDEMTDSNSADEEEEEEGEEDEEDDEEDQGYNPADNITTFDWNDLHERYHKAIDKCQDQESELMQEWESLMTYFRIWAESGHGHETGRTYSRLRTRMTYVQHSEEKLEKTRNHYTNVVRAFESALNLLKANGFDAA